MLINRYLASPNETWKMLCERVASLMAYSSEREAIKGELLLKRFLPNTPCLANAGRIGRNLMACHFIEVENSIDGIFNAVKQAATVFKSAGGLGIGLSNLSPYGTPLRGGGIASGPASFLRIFDVAAQVVMEGGLRRAAIMASLNAAHPDCNRFVVAKAEDGVLENATIGVAADHGPDSVLPSLWKFIVRQAHHNGEPSMIFLDNINAANPTLEVFGPIKGVNACGELPMYNMGSCCLASVNLPVAINRLGDYSDLCNTVRLMVHFLNRVIDLNHYPLSEIAQATRRDRRIGIGVMGWSDLLERERIPFASSEANALATEICHEIYSTADGESWLLAEVDGGCLPGERRNATLMAIAPTGHISQLADVSPSIYPPYSIGLRLGVDQHLDSIAAWKLVDSGISYTVSIPREAEPTVVEAIFKGTHERGLKAISVYPDGSRKGQPLQCVECST